MFDMSKVKNYVLKNKKKNIFKGLLNFQSVKIKAFGLCDSDRESIRAREVVQMRTSLTANSDCF